MILCILSELHMFISGQTVTSGYYETTSCKSNLKAAISWNGYHGDVTQTQLVMDKLCHFIQDSATLHKVPLIDLRLGLENILIHSYIYWKYNYIQTKLIQIKLNTSWKLWKLVLSMILPHRTWRHFDVVSISHKHKCLFKHKYLIMLMSGTVLVLIKLTKFAVALRLRCGSCKLIFCIISSFFL